ncbi:MULTISPECIES: DNA repair protein RecO [Thalassolituus]|jgi:DNA repair protein RecO (recombination protein O)|uniref:DNA repair protein RecO n=1 Tax=Thalassolituus TaxID=187492 RepID=UPI00042DD8E4|nr:DNA repair protein RecO [Thalassolituus oleivorans]AHK17733.1 hypothetical protein R615_12760 [Thalassolituus oleivorans R6-15]
MKQWFVLQRQPLREDDWLLDIFSLSAGRLRVISQAMVGRDEPDLLCLCQGDWQQGQDFPRVKASEVIARPNLQGVPLYCAVYITELLARLMPQHESHPTVFTLYLDTLDALADTPLVDPWLRHFEFQLLQQLGYGFSWQKDTLGNNIEPSSHYVFSGGEGFVLAAKGYSGAVILAIGNGDYQFPTALNVAKLILRQALEAQLTRPLISRELFI